MTPVFLFSLPRSGSTLLQRMIAAHPKVTTSAEPWMLLPLCYMRKTNASYTEYWHERAAIALNDILDSHPDGDEVFFEAIRRFSEAIYDHAAIKKSAAYFLEKTPRYHLIVDQIAQIFPSAKFIFLWRNPLAVTASMSNTWASGKWNVYDYYVDLYGGAKNLCNAYRKHGSRSIAVRYEDLLNAPSMSLKEIFTFLDLEDFTDAATSFSEVKLIGRMQDPSGVKKYSAVNESRAEDWLGYYSNSIRKAWGRRYLNWIGEDNLSLMGYSTFDLNSKLSSAPSTGTLIMSDMLRIAYGFLSGIAETEMFRAKLSRTDIFQLCAKHK